jgi:hypothetical protein
MFSIRADHRRQEGSDRTTVMFTSRLDLPGDRFSTGPLV